MVIVLSLAVGAPTTVADPASPGDPAARAVAVQPARGSFAGHLGDSNLTLLVALDASGAAFAYACADDGTAAWFSGSSDDGILRLDGRDSHLRGNVSSGTLTGQLTRGGQIYPFELFPLRHGGLYASQDHVRTWIVLDDGSHVGAVQQGKAVRLDRLSRKWGRLTMPLVEEVSLAEGAPEVSL